MNELFLTAIEADIRIMNKGDLRRTDQDLTFDEKPCRVTVERVTNPLGCETINIRVNIER